METPDDETRAVVPARTGKLWRKRRVVASTALESINVMEDRPGARRESDLDSNLDSSADARQLRHSGQAPAPLTVQRENVSEPDYVEVGLRLPRDTFEAIGFAALGEGLTRQEVIIRLLESGLARLPRALDRGDAATQDY